MPMTRPWIWTSLAGTRMGSSWGLAGLRGTRPPPPRVADEALERGLFPAHQRHHDVLVIGVLGLLADDVVAVEDVVLHHGFALHLQDKNILRAGEVAERNRLRV